MKYIISILLIFVSLFCYCKEQQALKEIDVKTTVESGDIYRTTYIDGPTLEPNVTN